MGHVLAATSTDPNEHSNRESSGRIVRILKKKLFGNSPMENVIISESVMNAIRVSQLVITKTHSVSPTRKLRPDGALLRIFSTTQLGRSIMPLVFIRSRIRKCFYRKGRYFQDCALVMSYESK